MVCKEWVDIFCFTHLCSVTLILKIKVMAISNKISGIFSGFSFTNNIGKMRKALVEYFTDEGIKCEIKDGSVICEYQDGIYTINFAAGEDYAECGIVYELADDSYTALDLAEKTFIADKTNIELENHAVVYAFAESLKFVSTFYFTSSKMMLELFVKHFDELNETIGLAIDVAKNVMQNDAEEGEEKPKQIGFCVQNDSANESGDKISAKNK